MKIAALFLLLFVPEVFGAGPVMGMADGRGLAADAAPAQTLGQLPATFAGDLPCGAQFATADLENTYWRLTRLGDKPVTVAENRREPHLVLRSEDHRVDGLGGCNRISGNYILAGNRITFGEMASTMMACADGMDTERTFLEALACVKTWKITGEHLELFDGNGSVLARFEARYLR